MLNRAYNAFKIMVVAMALLFLFAPGLSGEAAPVEPASDLIPWERQDILPAQSMEAPRFNPLELPESAALKMITLYRRRIATQSISRCPFEPSCSQFAELAIRRRGLILGLASFIDRHLYREHAAAYGLYRFVEIGFGRLKLDDRFYLEGR